MTNRTPLAKSLIAVAVVGGVLMSAVTVFELSRFYSFHERVRKILSGDYQGVAKVQLLDGKVKGLKEIANSSSESASIEQSYNQRVAEIKKDLSSLRSIINDKALDDAERIIDRAATLKSSGETAIFGEYKKIKQQAFEIYRIAWGNKWMTVAKIMGQIIGDLDEIPYDSGEKVQKVVFPRVTQLVSIVTNSFIAQSQKLYLFEQLNILKNHVNAYQASVDKSAKLRADRIDAITKVENLIKKVFETQARNLTTFGAAFQPELVHALIGGAAFLLFGFLWLYGLANRSKRVVAGDFRVLRETLEKWKAQGVVPDQDPKMTYTECRSFYDDLRKLGAVLREKEEAEACLHDYGQTPQIVVSTSKNAIIWNASFSSLAKQRKFAELGPVSYGRIVRFLDGRGSPIDPIEKCMLEGKDISQLCLLRVGSDTVPVYVQCTPVYESAEVISNVVVELRDLRTEQRRLESEIEKQVTYIDSALEALKAGKVPAESAEGAKQSINAFIAKLRQYALREQEKHDVLIGQIELLWTRIAKESDLGKRTVDQVDDVRAQVSGLESTLKEVCDQAKNLGWMQESSATVSAEVQRKLQSLRRQFDALGSEMQKSKRMLTSATNSLSKSQAVLTKVRALQKVIEAILNRSAVLNANNAIMGAQTLSANDVVSISENISEVLNQFDRGYGHLSSVVNVLEKGFKESNDRILQDVQICMRILADDEQLVREVKALEQAHERGFQELARVFEAAKTLENAAIRTASALTSVSEKTEALAHLNQSTQELHVQIEENLKTVFTHVGIELESKKSVDSNNY